MSIKSVIPYLIRDLHTLIKAGVDVLRVTAEALAEVAPGRPSVNRGRR